MSVPEHERRDSKFKVIDSALDLCCYTLKICSNTKVFLPEFDSAITKDIRDCAKAIYLNAFSANDTIVRVGYEGQAEFDRRLELQSLAIEECGRLLSLINIAKKVFHLTTRRMDYWSGMIKLTRSLLRSWKDSDKQRYKTMLGL